MAWWSILVFLLGVTIAHAANNPEIVVEWHPNDEHVNPNREGKGVYPLTINGNRGGTSVGARFVLWLPPGVHCESLYDSSYGPGKKTLHLFIDAMQTPQCQGHKYAHFDVQGGYCQAPDRMHWNVALPATRRSIDIAPAAMVWWVGVKMDPLRNTASHFSLTQTWPAADDTEIPYVVGDPDTHGAQVFQWPVFMDCRNVFP